MAEQHADPGSVRGRGSAILLPRAGNPFNPEARPTDLIPGYPTGTPSELAQPEGDEDVAPGLPSWTDGGDPRTPGTAHYEPPPDGAPPVIAPTVSAAEDGGPMTTNPASIASKETVVAPGALLVDRLASADEDGAATAPAQPLASPGLPANARLARLLAPDQDLQRLWNEINSIERALVERQRISLAVARDLLTLLQSARNRLLNARDHYEEAARDVAEVRFRLLRWDQIKFWEQPRFLWWYLVLHVPFLAVAAIAPILLPDVFAEVATRVMRFEGLQMMDPVVLWMTIVSGGFGGILGAAFNLFKHTSQVKDYDPDYAYWYLLYAPVGMLLAVAVFLIGRSGLILGVQDPVLSLYVFSFAGGFQQSLVLRWFNTLLRRLLPGEERRA